MKNYSFLAILASFLAFSCTYSPQEPDMTKDDTFVIEESADEELQPETEEFEVVLDEQAAEDINKETEQEISEEVIEVQDRVFFSYDSAALSDAAKKILATQTEWLKNNQNVAIAIEGHCDERGTREYNIALGERRAFAAKKYLTSNGIEASRINTISYGKERPAFHGNSREIHAKNRRAVVIEKQ
jgi:peptidoglycan-associated lipoprotein